MKFAFVLVGLSCLTACGGTSTDFDFDVPNFQNTFNPPIGQLPPTIPKITDRSVPIFTSQNDVRQAGLATLTEFRDLGTTPFENFETSGTAIFQGSLVINDNSALNLATVAGGLRLDVDFANAENVTGKATNFWDVDSTRVNGTLTLSDVVLGPTIFGGTLQGQLSDVGPRGLEQDIDYDISIAGLYFGENQDAILGSVSGTAQGTGGGLERAVSGAFTTERD